jgi:hypothetical protein
LGGIRSRQGDLVAPHHDASTGVSSLHVTQVLVTVAKEAHHEVVAGHEDLYWIVDGISDGER